MSGSRVELRSAEDLTDPRLAPYTSMTDAALRRAVDAEHGIYLAESSQVVRRALAAGHTPRSFLLAHRYLDSFADVLGAHPHVPVFTGPDDVLTALTGFHLHRGALAAMDRPVQPDAREVLAGARRVLVAEDLVDHTNLGAIVRSAAALGWDGMLVTPRAADPLYRRAIRVSMGTVFRLPWARLDAPVFPSVSGCCARPGIGSWPSRSPTRRTTSTRPTWTSSDTPSGPRSSSVRRGRACGRRPSLCVTRT